MMDDDALIALWKPEEQQPFEGWDFSYLKDRYSEEAPPWTYEQMVRDLLPGAESVLDMGTGGGEKLLEFKDALPANTVATEGYAPNVPVACANLEPHGIRVIDYNLEVMPRMPFDDNTFALIINRHEAFDAKEVARILRPGGVFLTQQVDGRELGDFRAHFGYQSMFLHVNVENCSQGLLNAGLEITRSEEWTGKSTYQDIGALVYFLHAAPWSAPEDFSVERYAPQLLALYRKGEPIQFTIRRFYIQARKPVQAS
jgi:SAM-dependent methyltransferase